MSPLFRMHIGIVLYASSFLCILLSRSISDGLFRAPTPSTSSSSSSSVCCCIIPFAVIPFLKWRLQISRPLFVIQMRTEYAMYSFVSLFSFFNLRDALFENMSISVLFDFCDSQRSLITYRCIVLCHFCISVILFVF